MVIKVIKIIYDDISAWVVPALLCASAIIMLLLVALGVIPYPGLWVYLGVLIGLFVLVMFKLLVVYLNECWARAKEL